MSVQLDPYLFFRGNCREAMEFYKDIFGGNLDVSLFEDSPGDFPEKETMKGKVMHALLSGGDIRLMGSDTTQASEKAAKIELSLSGEDEEKLTKLFNSLSEGGTVRSPLKKEAWGDTFGMVTDKYNIDWMVNITAKKA